MGHQGDDETREDLEAWGAPAGVVAAMEQRDAEATFGIWPENETALRLFLRLPTAWREHGLDYPSLRIVMESMGHWPDDDLFADLQAMEWAALDEMRKNG